MKTLNSLTILIALTFTLTLIAYTDSSAQCVVTGNTPDGGEVVNCSGIETSGLVTTDQDDDITIEPDADITDPGGTNVIQTLLGSDKVLMKGGSIFTPDNEDSCIEFGIEMDGGGLYEFHMLDGNLDCGHAARVRNLSGGKGKFTIEGGTLFGDDECLTTGSQDDEYYISGGVFNCGNAIIQSQSGNDTVIITGGRLTQTNDSDEGVETGGDNDVISVSNAIVDGSVAQDRHAIAGGSGDDTVRLGTGAVILGLSSGDAGFDTLVFEMGVTDTLIPSLCSQILAQDPSGGEITINGLFYEWELFEVILCELVPAEPRPIPTLSQWGMIAMAGVIGIMGLLVLKRRKAAV